MGSGTGANAAEMNADGFEARLGTDSAFIDAGQVDRDGHSVVLHIVSCGPVSAPPLLFLHGFPEHWLAWRSQLEHLAGRYRCHALDLRGFNLSSQPVDPIDYRVDALLNDIDAVIDWIERQSGKLAALIAHDWGGALAWSYAARQPGRVGRLIVANAPHAVSFARALAHDPEQIRASQYMNWLRAPGAEMRLAENDFARLFAMIGPLDPPSRLAYRRAWQRGLTGGCNYYRASALYPDTDDTPGRMARVAAGLDPALFHVDVPTLVLWGTADTALLPTLLDGLDEWVPRLRVRRLPDAGHWLLREAPGAVNTAIEDFLADAARI